MDTFEDAHDAIANKALEMVEDRDANLLWPLSLLASETVMLSIICSNPSLETPLMLSLKFLRSALPKPCHITSSTPVSLDTLLLLFEAFSTL